MSKSKTSQLFQVSEIRLSYRSKVRASQRPKVSCADDAYRLLLHHWDIDKLDLLEEFKVLLLNRANRVLGLVPISSGGIAGTIADPKLIFAAALKAGASSIIAVHNHPSGNMKPSEADIKLTRKLKEAGTFLDLPLLDHLIITAENYFSFADEGLL